ncbi:hypothetical protein AgCh_038108 [Apium graveolens]
MPISQAGFVPEFVSTEEKKARRFQQGLKPWIQNRVAILELTDYATLVQKATIVEVGSEQMQKEREEKGIKRKSMSMGGGSAGRSFPTRFNRGAVSLPGRNTGFKRPMSVSVSQGGQKSRMSYPNQSRPPLPACNICGRNHTGECKGRPVISVTPPDPGSGIRVVTVFLSTISLYSINNK